MIALGWFLLIYYLERFFHLSDDCFAHWLSCRNGKRRTPAFRITRSDKRVQTSLNNLSDVTELKDKNSVYWVERGGRRNQIIYLRSAPLEIASVLREELFSKNSSILMTSATISRKGSTQFFRDQVGAI